LSLRVKRTLFPLRLLPRLKRTRRSRRNIEAHSARFLAVERQRRVCLKEMIVRTDLDRPITRIGHRERHGLAAVVELDLAVLNEQFTRDHQITPANRPAPTKTQRGTAMRIAGRKAKYVIDFAKPMPRRCNPAVASAKPAMYSAPLTTSVTSLPCA